MIHFAGLKAVGESVANPRRYFDNNLIGTINLYEVMAKHDCKKVCALLLGTCQMISIFLLCCPGLLDGYTVYDHYLIILLQDCVYCLPEFQH